MKNKYTSSGAQLLLQLKTSPSQIVFYPILTKTIKKNCFSIGAVLIKGETVIPFGDLEYSVSCQKSEWAFLHYMDEVNQITDCSMILATTFDITNVKNSFDATEHAETFSEIWYTFFKLYRPMAQKESFLSEWNLYIFHNLSEYII